MCDCDSAKALDAAAKFVKVSPEAAARHRLSWYLSVCFVELETKGGPLADDAESNTKSLSPGVRAFVTIYRSYINIGGLYH